MTATISTAIDYISLRETMRGAEERANVIWAMSLALSGVELPDSARAYLAQGIRILSANMASSLEDENAIFDEEARHVAEQFA